MQNTNISILLITTHLHLPELCSSRFKTSQFIRYMYRFSANIYIEERFLSIMCRGVLAENDKSNSIIVANGLILYARIIKA